MKIKELNTNEIIEMYKHLNDDFPDNEIRELENIISLINRNNYLGYGLYLENKCIAYALLAQTYISNYLLLDYFAVKKEYRSKHYGSVLIEYISKMERNCYGMVAEVESLASAMNISQSIERKRRIQFYERHHFTHTNINAIVYGVEYSLLFLPMKKEQKKEEIMFGIKEIYDTIFSKQVLENHVELQKNIKKYEI